MILYISIILFNYLAIKINKIPTMNRIVHIWLFSITFQLLFDIIVEFKYHGYWYFEKGVDLYGLPAHFLLTPPINVLLLSWFPYKSNILRQSIYIICWTIGVVTYEAIALLPEPWGFFHCGWWKLRYDLIVVPILILALAGFYKWIVTLEKKLIDSSKKFG